MIKKGDVVQLKSGGPKMTVYRIIGGVTNSETDNFQDEILKSAGRKEGDIICQWFIKDKLVSDTFDSELIKLIEN